MEATFEYIEVRDKTGTVFPARLMHCECGCNAFAVFQLKIHNHPHLQCIECGKSYCSSRDACHIEEPAQ